MLKNTPSELDPTSDLNLGNIIANSSSVLLWISNTEKECVYFNKAWLNYRGRTLEEEYGFGWADGVHKDDFERCLDIYTKAFDSRQPFSMDYRLQKKDGSYGWIKDDGVPHFDEDGVFRGYVGSCYEISEVKTLLTELESNERELIEREKTLQDIMDCSSAVIFVKNLEGRYQFVNQRYLANLGLSKQDVIGKTDLDFLPEKTAIEVRENDLKVIRSNRHLVIEEEIPQLVGVRLYTSEKFLLVDSKGKAYALCGISTDITERRRQELQLRQSQKMEAIGQLAGGVAHDFNNQLASIMGFAELIEFTEDIQEVKKHIKKIISAAEHSSNLTNQLLAFSRKENVRQESIDIHQQIHQTIELLGHAIDKRIDIKTDLNASNHIVTGDKSLVQNALLNLGLNARDAMPNGGMITISTKNLESLESELIDAVSTSTKTPFVQIDISDTGRGISDTDIPRIFEPFYTTKESGKGTGLGLASVYGTIESMGGKINVESQVGTGTNFRVYLPVAESIEGLDSATNAKETLKRSHSKTILLADDEPLIRELCEEFFNVLGHQGLFAKDGIEATKLYAERWNEIDLVILDMIMPAMNGRETFYKLKQINPSVKVIMSSGFTAENSSAELISDGVLKVMRKPFKLSELKSCIEEISNL